MRKVASLVNGVPHLVSVTWASDDSSMWVLEYLYTQWMNDPSYSLFLFTGQDAQLQSHSIQVIVGSNRTFFNFLASDKADFTAHYPYMWTLLTTRDQIPASDHDTQLNVRAQQYHRDFSNGVVQPSLRRARRPVRGASRAVCLYTHQTMSIQNLTASGYATVNQCHQSGTTGGGCYTGRL